MWQVDSPLLQTVKTLIRYTEAISAAGACGVPEKRAHFLDMPFYETGVCVALSHACLLCTRQNISVFDKKEMIEPVWLCSGRHNCKEGAV